MYEKRNGFDCPNGKSLMKNGEELRVNICRDKTIFIALNVRVPSSTFLFKYNKIKKK